MGRTTVSELLRWKELVHGTRSQSRQEALRHVTVHGSRTVSSGRRLSWGAVVQNPGQLTGYQQSKDSPRLGHTRGRPQCSGRADPQSSSNLGGGSVRLSRGWHPRQSSSVKGRGLTSVQFILSNVYEARSDARHCLSPRGASGNKNDKDTELGQLTFWCKVWESEATTDSQGGQSADRGMTHGKPLARERG